MSSTGTAILLSSLYPQNSKHRKVNTDYTERINWDRVTFIYILMQIQHSPWNTCIHTRYGFRIYASGYLFVIDSHRGTTWCTITSISTSRSIKFYSEFLNFHSRNHIDSFDYLVPGSKKIDAPLSSIDESQWLPPKIYWYNAICIFGTDAISNMPLVTHGPLTIYVKLRVAHAPEMPGKFSPPLAGGFLWSRWRMNENELYHVPGNGGLSLMSDWYMSI